MIAAMLMYVSIANAHCDTLDGPVIEDARMALQKGDPTATLKWVKKEHEAEIVNAFAETVAVRSKGDDVRAFADRYFFETLVRLHRAGEGEPYSGLKASGHGHPAVLAADDALISGSLESLTKKFSAEVRRGIHQRFASVREKKKYADASIEAGREYVEAYVEYVHFLERIHDLIVNGASNSETAREHAP
jgi:hypothetical protein